MSASSGWYDDPRDPTMLRYWDGVLWTEHVTPKQSPTAAQSHIGEAYHVPPARAQQPASAQRPASHPWQQGTGGYASAPQWQQPRTLGVVTTPDGVETSGWWKRVLARFLDGLFASLLALPLTGYFYWQYVRVIQSWAAGVVADAEAGRTSTSMMLPAQAYRYLVPAVLIGLVVYAAYEVVFLTRSGATPGKKIVGISVRLREVPGPPPVGAVLKRLAVLLGPSVLAVIPILGSFLGLFQFVDDLWPLWDQRRQALHDKFAATNVVVGPQPRRGLRSDAVEDRPADQLGSGGR